MTDAILASIPVILALVVWTGLALALASELADDGIGRGS